MRGSHTNSLTSLKTTPWVASPFDRGCNADAYDQATVTIALLDLLAGQNVATMRRSDPKPSVRVGEQSSRPHPASDSLVQLKTTYIRIAPSV